MFCRAHPPAPPLPGCRRREPAPAAAKRPAPVLFVILLKAKLRPPFLPPAANLGSRSCRPCRRNSRRRAARSAKGPSRRAAQLAAADAMRRIMPYFKPPRRISAYRRTNPPAIPRLRTLSRAPFRSRVPPFSAARPLCAQGGLPAAHRARRTLPD